MISNAKTKEKVLKWPIAFSRIITAMAMHNNYYAFQMAHQKEDPFQKAMCQTTGTWEL